MAVRQHRGNPVTSRDAQRLEAAREARDSLAQDGVRQPDVSVDQCLALRMALRGVGQAQREIHEAFATSAIASTIGSYPVHRQRCPDNMSTISSRAGVPSCSSKLAETSRT